MGAAMAVSGKRLVFHRTGQPRDVLALTPASSTAPDEGEALVRILAASINPADLNTINGTYGAKVSLPATPGIEGCGEVVSSRADGLRAGDRVMFLRRGSTWASHSTMPATSLFKLPERMDPIQAALLKTNPATAWRLLRGFETLAPGDWIVQNLGNSAVGRCVIQLARDLGVRTVSFVRREAVAAELLESGADLVLLDDEEGAAQAMEAMGGATAALAFNAVGGSSALRLTALLRESGQHITYGAMAREPITISNSLLIFRGIRFRGLWVSRWVEQTAPDEVESVYRGLTEKVMTRRLVQAVDRTFALEGWQDALSRLDAPDRNGKVLFEP